MLDKRVVADGSAATDGITPTTQGMPSVLATMKSAVGGVGIGLVLCRGQDVSGRKRCRGENGVGAKTIGAPSHRFENWNDRRALALPYFLRSTTRLSRVRKPPRLRTLRNSGSKFVSALERPWRTAPAWPDNPPPDTRQMTSYWPLRLERTTGCSIIKRTTCPRQNTTNSRPLTGI